MKIMKKKKDFACKHECTDIDSCKKHLGDFIQSLHSFVNCNV